MINTKLNKLEKYKNYLNNVLGYSPKTISTYLFYIEKLLKYKNYKIFMDNHITKTNNTKRVLLSAVKNFYKFENNKFKADIILPKKEKNIKPHIEFEDYQKLLTFLFLRRKINLKKILIIKLLFETGIRSSELLLIKVSDLLDRQILINGKNKKQRIVYISLDLLNLINEYVNKNKLTKNDLLFNFKYRNLHKLIKTLGKFINKDLSPHMFRRGFATYCMDKDIGIYQISLILGHDNINTTKTYLRNESKIEIMKNIF